MASGLRMDLQAINWALRRVLQSCNKDEGSARSCTVVRLTGLLHWDERHALKYIARQLCAAFEFKFRPGASFEENLTFYNEVLQLMSK